MVRIYIYIKGINIKFIVEIIYNFGFFLIIVKEVEELD